MSPQRRVSRDGAEVSADGGHRHHRLDVQQPKDAEEELQRKSREAKRPRQGHR